MIDPLLFSLFVVFSLISFAHPLPLISPSFFFFFIRLQRQDGEDVAVKGVEKEVTEVFTSLGEPPSLRLLTRPLVETDSKAINRQSRGGSCVQRQQN